MQVNAYGEDDGSCLAIAAQRISGYGVQRTHGEIGCKRGNVTAHRTYVRVSNPKPTL